MKKYASLFAILVLGTQHSVQAVERQETESSSLKSFGTDTDTTVYKLPICQNDVNDDYVARIDYLVRQYAEENRRFHAEMFDIDSDEDGSELFGAAFKRWQSEQKNASMLGKPNYLETGGGTEDHVSNKTSSYQLKQEEEEKKETQ